MNANEIPRGQISTIILSSLIDKDKYGYEIIKSIEEKTNGAVLIKQPSLYSCLQRMEKQGFISSYWRDSEIGGKRHYYSLTESGKFQMGLSKKDFETSKSMVESLISNNIKNEQINIPKDEINLTETYFQSNLFGNQTIINNDITNSVSKSKNETEVVPEPFADKFFWHGILMSQISLAKLINQNDVDKKNFDVKPALNTQFNFLRELENKKSSVQSFYDCVKSGYVVNKFSPVESNLTTPNEKKEINEDNSTFSKNVNNEDFIIKTNEKAVVMEPKIGELKKDDGVFITEHPDPDKLPKVKKIEPAVFESVQSGNSINLIKKEQDLTYKDLVEELYKKSKIAIVDSSHASETNSFEDLKKIFAEQNVKFCIYEKFGNQTITQSKNDKIGVRKTNIIVFSIIFVLNILESMIIFFSAKGANVLAPYLFVLLPALIAIPIISNVIMLACNGEHNLNKEQITKSKFLYSVCFVLIGIGLLFGINLFFGLTSLSFNLFSATFLLPCLMLLDIPIELIIRYFEYKIK
ncbi:MAG: helix-turn-helix transcriptional regulator [Clostridia bacterium]